MTSAPQVAEAVECFDIDGPVHVTAWGSARRRCVCLHGFGENHLVWREAARALDGVVSVWAPDLPGFGSSPREDRPLTVEAMTGVVARLIEDVASEPVVVVANSLSGVYAAAVAGAHPELVRGLVLSSSYAPPCLDVRLPTDLASMAWSAVKRSARATTRSVGYRRDRAKRRAARYTAFITERKLGPGEMDEFVEAQAQRANDTSLRREGAEMLVSMTKLSLDRRRVHALFDAIEQPVLLVHGTRDHTVPFRWVQALAARHPGWQCRAVEGGPHDLQMAMPYRWAGIVSPWIAQEFGV